MVSDVVSVLWGSYCVVVAIMVGMGYVWCSVLIFGLLTS